MKNIRIVIIVGILVGVNLVPILNATDQIQKENDQKNFTYEYSNGNKLVITFHVTELLEKQMITELGNFIILELPNAGFIGTIGSPQLPAVTKVCAISTPSYSFEITNTHVKEIRDIGRIYPVQPPHSDNDGNEQSGFIYDELAYQKNAVTPEQIAKIVDDGNIRDIPFIKIQFCPIQYNPYQQIATIYDTIVVTLMFSQNEPVMVELDYTQKQFYPFYQNVFNNWYEFSDNTNFQERTSIKETGCDYLVITHQNYYTQAKQLADWKHYTGLQAKTVNVSDIGTTYQQIRQYIQTAYNTWAPCPSFVLLFGDAEFVPTTYVNGVATDLWYATVKGTDYYPDLFIGRIPADTTTQADVMVQKILTYEQTPPTLPSFYTDFVVAAYFQDDNRNGYEDRRFVRTSEEVRDYLLSQEYNGTRVYCTDSGVNPTHYNNGYYGSGEPLPPELLRPTFAWDGDAADIINAIEQGIFILNHRDHGGQSGWGDPYFEISHVNTLTNGELLPVVFSLNCLTGQFDTGECFCEAFLRKADGGAVAAFGATDVSYSGYNDYLCRGLYDAMWPDFDTEIGDNISMYHLGEILNYGKAFMADTWGDPWGYEEYEFELFHCFGDPALDLYTALPGNLEVTYECISNAIHVIVQGNGNLLQGARVCLSQENGFYRSGLTDAAGEVEFNYTGASIEDPLSIVVTAHNYLYYNASFFLNQKPQKPNRPTGSTEGKPNVEYVYKTSTIDGDGDQVYYNFSWGDGTYSDWVGPFNSGDEGFARHSWSKKGTYNITVKAKDVLGQESEWSEPLPITLPTEIPISHPILQWLSHIILNRFPLLAALLGLKGV